MLMGIVSGEYPSIYWTSWQFFVDHFLRKLEEASFRKGQIGPTLLVSYDRS